MTSRQPGLTAQDWLLRLLPLALLIVAGLAGLRGAVGAPRWDGPLHQDALAVGAVLEVLIVTMFVWGRRRSWPSCPRPGTPLFPRLNSPPADGNVRTANESAE